MNCPGHNNQVHLTKNDFPCNPTSSLCNNWSSFCYCWFT